MREFAKWCPTLIVVKVYGTREEKDEIIRKKLVPGKFDVILTSYEVFKSDIAQFKKFHFVYFVADEAHRMKNIESQISVLARKVTSSYRLLLTGTPLQNNLDEVGCHRRIRQITVANMLVFIKSCGPC
jgi:SWI/SNF-related matrix-associated actin-dependent regulator of chromatin subfamily A member 5